jgi:hypothetical protein
MSPNPHIAVLIDGHRVLPFKELSVPYQMALIWYMAVDGCAWEDVDLEDFPTDPVEFKAAIERAIPDYVRFYGEQMFGVVNVPSEAIKHSVMAVSAEISADFPSFDEYHQWYVSHNDTPSYGSENRWPVILSDFEDEVCQDGWHRLHAYLRAGHADVPAIFYLSE